ncbi:tubulin-binding protein, putative [Leishmania panamensis]|uniref:Tubulin-binding protein, putative n=1 Tax=Leishmania panamensis TaxID=5679 RepID=A0A088SBF7_LEIPA
MSVEDDVTIVSSWGQKAYHCFAKELEELQLLQQQQLQLTAQSQHELEERCKAEVDAQLLRELPDVFPHLASAFSASRSANGSQLSTPLPPSPPGRPSTKRPKSKHTHQRMQSEMAVVNAKRESLLQQHIQASMETQQRQPAHLLAAQYTEQLSRTQRQVELYLERETCELRRFTSKPLGAYALGEVLELPPTTTAPAAPAPAAAAPRTLSASHLAPSPALKYRTASFLRPEGTAPVAHHGTSERSVAALSNEPALRQKTKRTDRSGRTNGAAAACVHIAGKTGPAVLEKTGWSHQATDDTALLAIPPPFLIDAHQFAVEYNEMLKKEYGYCPAMTNTFATDEHAGSCEAAVMAAALKDQLRTHAPGVTNKRPTAAESSSWVLPLLETAARCVDTGAALSLLPAHASGEDGSDGKEPSSRLAHSFAKKKGLPTQPDTKKRATAGGSTSSPRQGGRVLPALSSVRGNILVSPTSNPLDGVECSSKGGGLSLSTYVGVPSRQVVRFVNRNAYRTRLRLKPASHPWLTYRCVCIAPSAAAAMVPPETPLNCGGYVEVEVVFCPTSFEASTATVEAVLEVGVTRELNDRVGKGAQWHFISVPLQGQVVLPHFEWWCSATADVTRSIVDTDEVALDGEPRALAEEEADDSVKAMDARGSAAAQAPWFITHDVLASRAARLDVSGPSSVVATFGNVLLLASVKQTLYLENTGSTAVVHVLSSSPEFTVSLPPVVPTALPTSHAMPLHVSFCPLSEGPCEGSLTVTVRASDAADSPVLTEHTVKLLGVGVVPRVRIASLGPQVVQEGAVPQWQLCKSEAPLNILLKGTIPSVPTEVPVTVRNDCAVPLPYHWHNGESPCTDESCGGDAESEQRGTHEEDQACIHERPATTTVTTFMAVTAVGVGANKTSYITPAFGILPPMSTTTFILTVTPHTLQPLQTLYNLFLDKMPDPSAPRNAAKLPFVDEGVLELYRRSRPIPCSAHGSAAYSVMPLDDPAVRAMAPPNGLQVTYLDPIAVFARFQTTQGEHSGYVDPDAVFATSFVTYQQPVLPTLSIDPAVLEEHVECLIQSRTTRTVSLHNSSPIAMHFVLDPTAAEFAASVQQYGYQTEHTNPILTHERWRASFPASDGISVQCQPRKGQIPPYGTVTITVHFTLEAIGPHYAVVPCWIPEVELLCARLTATSCASRGALSKCKSTSLPINPRALTSAGAAGRRILLTSPLQEASLGVGVRSGTANVASGGAGRRSKSASPSGTGGGLLSVTVTAAEDAQQQQHAEDCGYYALHVTATGVGPTVMTSTELLDFGLIELGQEAAASFTVSNPNSIPVLFDLCDPLMRQPPRFVFIPESFRLGAGNTVEVTVYRKVVSTEDAQTFFELTVRDGGASVAIETRATIQQPLLIIEDPVVQFGVVPESVWQCGVFHVSNRSALDTVFVVIPATPAPSYMELDYKAEHVLRAGEQLTVPVRCRFRICSTAITNHGNRGDTSASLVSLQKHTATAAGANDCYSTLLGVVSKRSRQTLLVEVRCDIVEPLAVSVDVVPEASPDGSGAVASTVHMSTEAYVRALLWNSLESILCARATAALDDSLVCGGHATPLVAHHYCAALSLVDYMLDDVPLSCLSLTVILKNYTGCEANYDVCAKHFTPLPLEALGAPRIQDKRRKKVEEGASRGSGSSRQASRAGASGGSRKTTQAQLQQRQEQPLSPFLALASRASTGSISNGGNDGAALPAFWIKSVQSDVTVQQQQWQMMEAAQKVLGDGRSCVTLLDSLAGSLGPYGQVQLPVRLLCTLPGRYAERLCVRANATLPWLQIPVDYEVYGKPIVLDTTTSGLITEGGRDGKEVLLMPPVIAPLGASRRTVRLVNRVSRDMDVTVNVFPCSLGMAVHAVDPDAPADQVELRLCAMTAEDQEKERNRVGRVTATPFQLRIPAHSRRDVLLEFTPTAKLTEESNADKYDTAPGGSSDCTGSAGGKGDGSTSTKGSSTVHAAHGSESEEDGEEAMLPPSDHWWEGSVCIHAMLAQSELNDVFLIDDFYARYADRYPSQRVARPISGAASAAGSKAAVCSSGSTSLSVAQLTVTQPLRIRPGGRVVRGGRVVWPCEAAQRVLDRAAAAGDALVPSITAAAAKPMDHSADSDDDNASSGGVLLNSQRPDSTLRLEVLQREAEERQALVAFMESRRRVLQEESHKYFTPIELRLRARCGRPHLAIEPSERCVSFPAVQHVNERTAAATSVVPLCTKTIRLTNRNSSALRFALSLSAANHSDGASLFSIVRCARWRSSQDAATELFTAGRTTSTAGAAAHEYTLDSMDALDVHVEVHTESSAWRQACAAVRAAPPLPSVSKKAPAVEGLLRVQFLPTSESAEAACTSPDNIVSAPCQLLPLRVLLTTPLLECSPGVVWFRPGQQRHDGRRQVAYPQKFVLLNRSAVPVSFQTHPVTDADGEAVRTFRLQQQQGMRYAYTGVFSPAASQGLLLTNATMTQLGISATQRQCDSITRKVKASVEMPALAPPAEGLPNLVYVDEPARFSLSPLEGVVPAASLGGEPGRLEVRVTFVEFSDLRYESLFKVIVVGTAAQPPTYVLLRGDSRDTEV